MHSIPLVIFSGMVIVGALWVVTLSNLFRAALSLGVVLIGIAGLFIILSAEFLAFVHILIYVGAILVLVVFAIMLTAKLQTAPELVIPRRPIVAAVAAVSLCALLIAGGEAILAAVSFPQEPAVGLHLLGLEMIKTLILPFEAISLVFVAAMVGAIALAVPSTSRKDSSSSVKAGRMRAGRDFGKQSAEGGLRKQ